MRFRLSHLVMLITLICVLVAWWTDHRSLTRQNEALNQEATQLFQAWALETQGSSVLLSAPPAPPRVYDFSLAADRAAYLASFEARSGIATTLTTP